MARIKTYPLDQIPTIKDKVVGTDFDESNATKNYEIGAILSVEGSTVYVPYTGANQDVALGPQSLQTNNLLLGGELYDNTGSTGVLGDTLSITVDGVKWVSLGLDSFVPYTGATSDVDLGAQSMSLLNMGLNGTLSDGFGFVGMNGQVLSSTGIATKWIDNPNLGTYVPYLGATSNVDLGLKSLKTYTLSIAKELYDEDSVAGSFGQVLSSTGNGTKWINAAAGGSFVPYTGALADVDLGAFSIQASNFIVSGTLTDSLSGVGTAGQVLSSTGTGVEWLDVDASRFIPYTGATESVDLGDWWLTAIQLITDQLITDSLIVDIIENSTQAIFNGDTYIIGRLFAGPFFVGTDGQYLASSVTGVEWRDIPAPDVSGLVPYTGATGSVNLGLFTISADGIFTTGFSAFAGDTFFKAGVLDVNGNVGSSGQVLSTNGVDAVEWTTIPTPDLSTLVPYDGATASVVLGANDLSARNIVSSTLIQAVGDIEAKQKIIDGVASAGVSGQILSSIGTEVRWIDPVFKQTISQASHGITLSAGIAAVADLQNGTNNVQQTNALLASLAPDYWVIAIPTSGTYTRIRAGLFTITGISAFMGDAKNIYLKDDGTIGPTAGATKIPVGTIVGTDLVDFYRPLKYVY